MWGQAAEIFGRVVAVADGDTVTVLDSQQVQHRIRLQGIDAPERRQPFGERSKQLLSSLVFRKAVLVKADKTDRYGRRVAVIYLDGVDINLRMLTAGMAWHYKKYENEQTVQERRSYTVAEDSARLGRVGLWSDPNPVPPWDFRRAQRK